MKNMSHYDANLVWEAVWYIIVTERKRVNQNMFQIINPIPSLIKNSSKYKKIVVHQLEMESEKVKIELLFTIKTNIENFPVIKRSPELRKVSSSYLLASD